MYQAALSVSGGARLGGPGDVLDVVPAHCDQAGDPLGRHGRRDAGRPAAPVEAAHDGAFDLECVEQVEQILAERTLLTRAQDVGAPIPGWPESPEVRGHNAHPRIGED